MAKVPASIRNKNPGAMYPGPSADKFGSTGHEVLRSADGEHLCATFPTFEQGGAAMLDLLSRKYVGMTLRAAITKWSGGIRSNAYIDAIEEATELTAGTPLSRATLEEHGVALCQAMASWEAGRQYPMTDAQWAKARDMAFDDVPLAAVIEEQDASVPAYVANAVAKLGMTERSEPGEHNLDILADFALVGRDDIKNDETAWCAAFTGARLAEVGYKLPVVPRDDLLMARSYLKLPIEVKPADVKPGDIRVESRGPAPYGHVEIVVSVDRAKGTCKTIGGNVGKTPDSAVSNTVAYRIKPLKGGALLGYRRPSRDPAPAKFVLKSPSGQSAAGLVAALVAWVTGAMDWVTNHAADAMGLLPTVVEKAAPHVNSVQQVYGWFDHSPSTYVIGAIIASTLLTLAYSALTAERAK
jgi:hypothetical protein